MKPNNMPKITPPTPTTGKEDIEKVKRDFDFMVKPEHSDRLWYVVGSLLSSQLQQQKRTIEEWAIEKSFPEDEDGITGFEKGYNKAVADLLTFLKSSQP